MPVAIETVIIVIVVVSFAVLSAVIFALYWLWRLLQEDRRCHRLHSSTYPHEWRYPSSTAHAEDGPQRSLLGSRRVRNPRITQRQEVFVDERSRRRVKPARCTECPSVRTTTSGMQTVPVPPVTSMSSSVVRNVPSVHSSISVNTNIHHASSTHSPEVIVLDGTEPPPPYEAIADVQLPRAL